MSRMLQLQDTFCNTKIGAMSITLLCHHLKYLVDGLNDVDSPISETELVKKILRQLPPCMIVSLMLSRIAILVPPIWKPKTFYSCMNLL